MFFKKYLLIKEKVMKTKVCKCCDKRKRVSSFYKSTVYKQGYDLYCKSCRNDKCKQYRDENLYDYQSKERKLRKKNYEKVKSYHQEYYSRPEIIEKTRKYQKKYKKKNKNKLKKYVQKYVQENKEYLRKRALIYYYKHRFEILKYKKKQRDEKR